MSNGDTKSNLIENLFLKGCVVHADIHIWSGRKKLSPVELGIPESEVNHDLVTLGSKWLVPKEEIQALEKIRLRTKSTTEKYSVEFSFGSFVPHEKTEKLEQELSSLKEDFDESVKSICERYPELRQQMLDAWQQEAIAISSRQNDPDLVFAVMNRIEQAFPKSLDGKFRFEWNKYHDINKIAERFIILATSDVVLKVAEFAQKIRDKITEDNLSEKTLTATRNNIEEMRTQMSAFENPLVDKILNDLEGWVQSGTANDASESKSLAQDMSKAMDKIIGTAEDNIQEIAMESVNMLTSYKRKIDLS